jgi:hypothetical protein
VVVELGTFAPGLDLVLDDDFAYVAGGGELVKVPKTGGAPTVLVSGGDVPAFLTVDATKVYFAGSGNTAYSLGAVSKVGNAVSVLWTGEACAGLATDDTRVYCALQYSALILGFDKATGAQTTIGTAAAEVRFAIAAGGYLYWGAEGDGTIGRTRIADGGKVILSNAAPWVWNIAMDADNVYWGRGQPQPGVLSVPKTGGATTVLAGCAVHSAVAIAVDPTHVYWIDQDAGAIHAVPKTGGGDDVIASGQAGPRAIAADANAVYWLNHTDGKLMRYTH